MAGGQGIRLSPLTIDSPKPMLLLGAKPILETILEQLKSYGYRNILMCLHYKGQMIENYFKGGADFGVDIKYIKQKKPLGTAGAIRLACEHLHKSFFVLNGDIITKLNFEQFMQYHIKNENDITIATKKYDMQVPYGVINMKDEHVISLVEKPAVEFYVNGGIYCLEPEAIRHIPENRHFDITELIASYLSANKKVGSFPITEYWMDVGRMDDYSKANVDYDKLFGGENSTTFE
jgi:NDP-sugar pyrophosphorylase family protein